MPRRLWWAFACVVGCAAGLMAQAPSAPRPGAPVGGSAGAVNTPAAPPANAVITGTGVIQGRVFRLADKTPVSKSRVALRGSTGAGSTASVTTDENGRYELTSIPAGRYTVSAARAGFLTTAFGEKRPGQPGQTLDVRDGERLDHVDMFLPAAGVISGVILDDIGEPMVQVAVEAMQLKYSQGTRQPVSSNVRAITDDRGQFRLFGLGAGSYLIRATVPGRSVSPGLGAIAIIGSVGAMSTFFPGTATASAAKVVRVEAASETAGIVFSVVPRRVAKITGVVRSAGGGALPAAEGVSLRVAQVMEGGTSSTSHAVKADGSFSITLSPGQYSLTAQRSLGSEGAMATVTLGEADVFVPLTLRQGNAARGRIVGDNGLPPESLEPAAVRIAPDTSDSPALFTSAAVVKDDWTFETPGLIGSKRLRVTVPREWTVRSIQSGSRDVTDAALDFNGKDISDIVIHLTRQVTHVTGVVTDARGQRVPDATVVVFSEDSARWQPRSRFIRAARPDQDGRFTVDGLPAARYLAVAVDYLETGEETNPETLDKLRRMGKVVVVRDGATAAIDLRVEEAP